MPLMKYRNSLAQAKEKTKSWTAISEAAYWPTITHKTVRPGLRRGTAAATIIR